MPCKWIHKFCPHSRSTQQHSHILYNNQHITLRKYFHWDQDFDKLRKPAHGTRTLVLYVMSYVWLKYKSTDRSKSCHFIDQTENLEWMCSWREMHWHYQINALLFCPPYNPVHPHSWLNAAPRLVGNELEENNSFGITQRGSDDGLVEADTEGLNEHKGSQPRHGTKCCIVPAFFIGW